MKGIIEEDVKRFEGHFVSLMEAIWTALSKIGTSAVLILLLYCEITMTLIHFVIYGLETLIWKIGRKEESDSVEKAERV